VLVREMLRSSWPGDFAFEHFDRIAAARDHLLVEGASCILLDLSLPDAHGLEAVDRVQSFAPDVPIVVLSGLDDEEMAVRAVQGGAQDYLIKGRVDDHLVSRSVRYAIERKRAEIALAHHALHDALTGLPNRALFVDRLKLALARSGRRQSSVAVLLLDLDRFKLINDSLGHEAGDRALIDVGGRLRRALRPGDTVAASVAISSPCCVRSALRASGADDRRADGSGGGRAVRARRRPRRKPSDRLDRHRHGRRVGTRRGCGRVARARRRRGHVLGQGPRQVASRAVAEEAGLIVASV
jgi:DNA-binding response OmpR family regulator